MSTRRRLEELTKDLTVPDGVASAAEAKVLPESQIVQGASREVQFPPAVPGVPAPRTGPGQMLAFRNQTLALDAEIARLKSELQRHDGSLPTRKLEPKLLVSSRWANRNEHSYLTADFVRFKAEIEHAGGNVQPILVRPLDGSPEKYEIVFGHRRHRACSELGLEVLAAIWTAPLSDAEFFQTMDRENRERADLSPYEHGVAYQRALDEHLYPSQRRLAEGLGVSHTWVQKALSIAQLPQQVIACFKNPLEIQTRHAEKIEAALEADRRSVLRRAEKLAGQQLSASVVVAQLIGQGASANAAKEIHVDGKTIGRVVREKNGGLSIKLRPGVVSEDRIDAVVHAIAGSLKN